jgi:mercuric ion transport protein
MKSWFGGVIAAIAASLCCIAPLLAIIGGLSGAATYFNWIAPYRTYLIGITVVVFAFAWYEQLAVVPKIEKDCCEHASRSFWQSKKFLLIITMFAAVLTAFPYYSGIFYKAPAKTTVVALQSNFKSIRLNIKGMTCADCTKHIDGSLISLKGVSISTTSFEKAQTVVLYNPAKTNADSIAHQIKEIGYHPTLVKQN